MRDRLFLLSFLLPVMLAFGQASQPVSPNTPTEAQRLTIDQRFAAGTGADLAWAARLIADSGDDKLVPQLMPLLESKDWQVRTAAIDGVIRARADLEDPLLAKLAGEHFDGAMIIAWQHLAQHTALLMRLLDKASDPHWAILNSLLVTAPPPGFAARLLREWTYQVTLTVYDAGHGPGLSLSSGGCGDRFLPPGYPPERDYSIKIGLPRSTAARMVAGRHPLSYSMGGDCRESSFTSRSEWTLDYVRDLLAGSADPPEPSLAFRDDEQYRSGAAMFAGRVRSYVNGLRAALIQEGRLKAEETATPRIEIRVNDVRRNNVAPLPKVEGVE